MLDSRRLKALIIKEILQIIRDPSSMLIAVVLPMILLFVFGYGVNLDSNRIKLGLVNEAQGQNVVSLVKTFTNSNFLKITQAKHRREIEEQIVKGTLRGMVIIPQNFSDFPTLKNAPIQVITDGTEPNIAAFAQGYVNGVLQLWFLFQNQDLGFNSQTASILVEPRFWFNPELMSRNFLVPGSVAVIMTLIGTLLTALVIAREWERGTMESLMATPISILEILLGKLIPYFILGMASLIVCTIVATKIYEVPLRGSFFALFLVSSIFLIAALAQGLLISSSARDQFIASQGALMSAYLPAFMLSGFIFEISSMPSFIRAITYIFPARYYVSSLQTIFMAGDIWPLLLKNMAAITIIAITLFGIIAHKTVKRLD